ncbi:acyl-CoA dehydrogenase [uncultured Litoreibacter sp.]|uniref:acyl-CoA dehydrogenase n=1 Tax=uncultured Litoreibacter sp. TaxID=1392394 RepID=UPI00261DD063|nr:acyl-CoA dehydrogenase [uncultured Litoreibacter sp.]
MPYRAPASEYQFLFDKVVGFSRVAETEKFAEATPDVTSAILEEAAKMCNEVLAPLQRNGDMHPAVLENGVVRTSPGFGDGYKAIAEGGWVGMAGDPEYGGMGLPQSLVNAVNEMMGGACLSLQLNPLMTQGQIEALEHHASDEIKELYLPNLISGAWSGTMNLTEPQAGSDVGALRTKAEPNGDGSYAVTGQKIYISWADNDFTENVCHLVLARLPDAKPGTKGISLFMVPKLIPDENGKPGVANSLKVVSLEHKMGLHGSPTAVMQFDGAQGWLVGEEHNGMAAMFTMMNNARLGVGGQGIAVAEAAYQHALGYAMDRKQGRAHEGETIIGHADVRRMLAEMKADIFTARAISAACALAIDMGNAQDDAAWKARAALLTPIAKAFGTDVGIDVAQKGIQVHGGMGFIEETGAAQYLRDVRVTAIYEGTNGIQAMDLVARKMIDGGEAAYALIDELEASIEGCKEGNSDLAAKVFTAFETLRETTEWLVEQDMNDRFAGSVAYLKLFARCLGGYYHLCAAHRAGEDGVRGRMARIYIQRLLPEHVGLAEHVRQGAADLYALSVEDLVA